MFNASSLDSAAEGVQSKRPSKIEREGATMAKWRRVCPWGCLGSKGEIAVVRAERASVPDVIAPTALVRCRECRGISIAGRVMLPAPFGKTQEVECRTPLGRFEASVWVPAALLVHPLILEPQSRRGLPQASTVGGTDRGGAVANADAPALGLLALRGWLSPLQLLGLQGLAAPTRWRMHGWTRKPISTILSWAPSHRHAVFAKHAD